MKKVLWIALPLSAIVFLLDFLILLNQNFSYYQDPVLGPLGVVIGFASLAILVMSMLIIMIRGAGRLFRRPVVAVPKPSLSLGQKLYRGLKITVGMLTLLFLTFGLPYLILVGFLHKQLPSGFLNQVIEVMVLGSFVVLQQVTVPTPVALAFWPAVVAAIFLLFSRRPHIIGDTLAFLAALGGVAGDCYLFLVFVVAQ